MDSKYIIGFVLVSEWLNMVVTSDQTIGLILTVFCIQILGHKVLAELVMVKIA